jgi:photosystem II stability/assembly factor-like uncharacterized protein
VGVAYTVDSGRTWSDVTPAGLTGFTPEYPSTIALYARSAAEAWTWLASFNGSSTTLWHTTDAGTSWQKDTARGNPGGIDIPANGALSSVLPTGEVFVAVTVNGRITLYHLTPGTSTWTQIATVGSSIPLLAGMTQLDFVNQMTGWAVTSAGLIATIDGGVTWAPWHA